ncbi:MAG: trehalose-6-phosphate synthase, partial [Bdellovibrionales bacterium]|nr:trehalose-6-phosphate synthase [Oligoflexia bacterium]
MKLSLRFILPLILVLSLVAFASVSLVDSLTLKWFMRDLDARAQLVASTFQDSLIIALTEKKSVEVQHLFERVSANERLFAIGLCDANQVMVAKTKVYPDSLSCTSSALPHEGQTQRSNLRESPLHLAVIPIVSGGNTLGHLILIHDMSFAIRRSEETRNYVVIFFIILAIVISLLTVVVLQLSWKGWVSGVRALLKGEGLFRPVSEMQSRRELLPFVKDLRGLVRELSGDLKNREDTQAPWTPATLKNILKQELTGDEILIVSNREPYIHERVGDQIEVQVPASGLVTA